MEPSFSFRGELFLALAEGAWVFVSLPGDQSEEIREMVPKRPGFGSVRVHAKIESTEWRTSIFPSKEYAAYLLPVKKSVRENEGIDAGDVVEVTIRLATA